MPLTALARFSVVAFPVRLGFLRSRFRCRRIVVHENAVSRSFHVVELSASQGPPEQRADDEHENDREGHQKIEDVHESGPDRMDQACGTTAAEAPAVSEGLRNRSAFTTTSTELAAMPSPAAQGVTQPKAASGTATTL